MPSVQSLVQDNRIIRNRLKAGLDTRKYPIEGPLWPLVYLAVKILRHEEALEVLADRGFGTEAGMILRSMFEATVNIMWILKDEDIIPKLKRYTDYQFVASQKYRDYAKDIKFVESLPDEKKEEYKQVVDDLDNRAREVKDEYDLNPYKPWSGKTLKEMANDVGWKERYDTLYKIYSDVIHSGIMAVQEYLKFDNNGKVTVNFRSQTDHCKVCLLEGKTYLLAAFGFLDVFLELGLGEFIDNNLPDRPLQFHKNFQM